MRHATIDLLDAVIAAGGVIETARVLDICRRCWTGTVVVMGVAEAVYVERLLPFGWQPWCRRTAREEFVVGGAYSLQECHCSGG